MQVVRVKMNDDTKQNVLLVPKNEWQKLNKILNKTDHDRTAEEMAKRLTNERSATSNAMAETRKNSELLNKRKYAIENKKKLLAENEARLQKKDEEIKLEHLKRKKEIVEKSRTIKWLDRDSTKTVTRALRKIEVLRERAMQVEFNKAERAKALEEERLLWLEQNSDAERYKRDRYEQKLKLAEKKEAYAAVLLKELKEREDLQRGEDLKLKEEGEIELQRIAREIKAEKEKEKARIRLTRENILKNENENREFVTKRNEERQLEEQTENMVVAVMNEMKKKIAKMTKLKEIELLEKKQKRADKMAEKAAQKENVLKNTSDQNARAMAEEAKKNEKKRLREEESKKRKKRDLEDGQKVIDEERRKENERLALSRQWELDRRLLETQVLRDLDKSNRQKSISEKTRYREQLDAQCEYNRKARTSEKRADLEHYETLVKLRRQENDEFMTYTNGLMDTLKKSGKPVVPLLEAIKMYTA